MSGRSTENEYWDVALSAGHYVLGVANDDLHYPDRSRCIAIRSNFLATPTLAYEDIVSTLRRGSFYAMRTPDYGGGDWQEKVCRNNTLTEVTAIGLRGDEVYIELSSKADSIKFSSPSAGRKTSIERSPEWLRICSIRRICASCSTGS